MPWQGRLIGPVSSQQKHKTTDIHCQNPTRTQKAQSGTVTTVKFIPFNRAQPSRKPNTRLPQWHITVKHRQLLPQIRFLKSFLDTSYSFRVLALRPGFTGPVLRQESPGALGFWVSPIFVELYASYCWEQSSSSSPGNIFLSLGLKFRFGLVWWHELGSESPVPCVSHGPLGG